MDPRSPSMRDIAQRWLTANQSACSSAHAAEVLIDRLRSPMIKFAGTAGFASLLRRALVLASEEEPSLRVVQVNAEGRLEGLDQLVAGTKHDAARAKIALRLAHHVLELLVTFIGESLTMTFVREAWPDTSPPKKTPPTETS